MAKAVLGAHTRGFNRDSTDKAVIGSYGATKPPGAAVTAVARLTAWKLGLHGAGPRGKTYLTSGGGNLYPKGKNVRLNVISGHRDGFATECPGKRLYAKLGTARSSAACYQGRRVGRSRARHRLRGTRRSHTVLSPISWETGWLSRVPPLRSAYTDRPKRVKRVVRPVPAGSRDDR